MSTTVDQRVVEMDFNNSNFEKNVQTSLNTLNKLKKNLDLSKSAEKLTDISKAANNVDFNGLSSAIDSIRSRFTTMGIVGATVISNLTTTAMQAISKITNAVKGLIVTGGINRALNIEKAKFQLEGLGVTWDKISEDIEYGVKDTAYGLDAAANVASQLIASNVKIGDSMKQALRGVSGVAAMTNSTYEEMGSIFTTVAGQGKLMTMQLRQLESRGLNAAAVIAKQLGKTEAQVRDMVTDGQISFETFSAAMDSAFGEHAKDSNKTFTGVISNIKSAFARMGAEFVTPLAKNEGPLVSMLNELKNRLNEIKTAIEPLAAMTVAAVTKISGAVESKLSRMDLTDSFSTFYNIVDSLKNVFSGLLTVLKPVRTAFASVFPKVTSKQILALSESLKNLTEKFKMSDTNASKLQRAFKGVFSVVKLLGDGLVFLVKEFFSLLGYTGPLGDGLLELAANLGDFLDNVTKTIRKSGTFEDVFGSIADTISKLAGSIKKGLDSIGNVDSSGITTFIDELKAKTKPLEIVGAVFTKVFDSIGWCLENAFPIISNVASKIGEVFTKLFSSIRDAWNGKDSDFASDVINGGILALVLMKLKSLIGVLIKGAQDLKPLFGREGVISGVLNQLRSSLYAWQQNLQSKTLLTLAGAIAMIAVSVLLLSGVDAGALTKATIAITALFANLMGAFQLMKGNKFKPFDTSMSTIARAMMTMSISVLILASAMKVLSKLNPEQVLAGVTAIGVLMLELVGAAKLMAANTNKMTKGLGGMILMAIAIRTLAGAVKKLGDLDIPTLAKGLISVGVLIGAVGGFVRLTGGSKKLISIGLGVTAVATALKILASAAKDFGQMDVGSLAKAGVAMVSLLGGLVAFTKFTGGTKNMISVGLGMIAIATAVKIMASALSDMGSMPMDSICRSLLLFGVSMSTLTVALKFMPKNMVGMGIGLIAVATAIKILASALADMGGMSVEAIAKSLITLFVALSEIAVFMHLFDGSLKSAITLVIISGAIVVLAGALKTLGSMGVGSIVKSLVTLAAVFGILGVAAGVLTPLIPAILGLSAAITLLGVGIAAFGAGVILIGLGLTAIGTGIATLAGALSVGAATIATGLAVIVSGLLCLIPTLGEKIGEGIIALCNVLMASVPVIAQAALTIVTTIVNTLVSCIPQVVKGVFTLLESVLNAVVEFTPILVQAAFDILLAVLDGIAKNISKVVQVGIDIVVGFIDGIAKKMPDVIQAGFDLIIGFITGLTDAINNNTATLVDAVNGLVLAIIKAAITVLTGGVKLFKEAGSLIMNSGLVKGIKAKTKDVKEAIGTVVTKAKDAISDKIKAFTEAGANVISGFVNGLMDGIKSVKDAAADIGNKALDSIKNILGIHSPSKEMYKVGTFVITGFVNAIKSTSSAAKIKSATTKLMSGFVTQASKAASISGYAKGAIKQFASAYGSATATAAKNTKVATKALSAYIQKLYEESDQYDEDKAAIKEHTKDLRKLRQEKAALEKQISKETNATTLKNLKDNLKETNAAIKTAKKQIVQDGKDVAAHAKALFKEITDGIKDSVKNFVDLLSVSMDTGISLYAKFSAASEEEERLANITQAESDLATATTELSDAQKALAEAQVKSDAVNGRSQSLLDKVAEAQERVTEATAAQIAASKALTEANSDTAVSDLLSNMESQVTGVTTLNEQLEYLSSTVINKKLLASLKALGTSGVSQVAAFAKMSTTELEKANELYLATEKLTSQTLLDNFKDKLTQASTWASNMQKLATLNLSDTVKTALLESLGEQGVDSADYLNAILGMDESQLAAFNKAYKQYLTLPEDVANSVISSYAAVGTDSADTMMSALTSATSMKAATNAGSTTAKAATTGVTTTITAEKTNVTNAASALGKSVVTALKGYLSIAKGEALANNLTNGIITGLQNNTSKVAAAAKAVAASAYAAACAELGIQSPSKAFAKIGMYSDLGMAKGLKQYSSSVADASKNVGDTALSTMSKSIARVAELADVHMDSNPVIRPVLDLTDVQSGASQLHNMFGTETIDAINSGKLASSISRRMGTNGINQNDSVNGPIDNTQQTITNNNTFNITGNDPNAIANEVSRVLQHQVNRKDAAWA